MKVVHVMGRMAPSGTELQLAGMLRAARDGHWQPTLCVLRPGYPLARELADDGIEVIELPAGGRTHVRRMAQLRALTRSERFDVVHTSLWGASAFGRTSVLGPGRPAVVMSERRVEDFRPRPQRLADRALARVTDQWIGNSQDVCDFIGRAHGVGPDRITLITNGLDTSVFRPSSRERPPGAPARIGALGRLVHQKGFDTLIAALPAITSAEPVEVIVVGEGELRASLEARAVGLPITFPGARSGAAAVAEFLQGLDLFVMPSRYEGLPNAVLEAAACGIPIVATDVPGMRQALGPDARLVPAEDPAALAAAVIGALRNGVGAVARDRLPSFDEVAAAHRRVFARAVARHQRTPATAGVS